MRRSIVLASAAALLGGCGRSDDGAANQAAANAAQPKKKAAHCFFKDSETKDWKASRGKDGNIVVKGKAYRSDSRYQALLGPPEVTGTRASIALRALTSVPPSTSFAVMVMSTVPAGQACARSSSSDSGWQSTTSVLSSITTGHVPTEWCKSEPTCGHLSSTSRIRVAPTTQSG